jgi:hypothetical protein
MSSEPTRYVEALEEAAVAPILRRWRADHPAMGVLALVPEAEGRRVESLQKICRAEGVPLVGAVFPSLVVGHRFSTGGAWLLRLDVMPYVHLHAALPRDGGDLGLVADALADDLRPHLGGASELTLLLLFDATFPRVGSLLDELYLRLSDRVHYMGANAGSETFQPIPCLFDADRLIQGGLLAVLLEGRGAVLEHGYRVPTRMIAATSTEGNRIIQIDWRPAFEVYQAMGHMLHGAEITRENFYSCAVHFPFGIVRANGIILVRIPVSLEEDGSLFCAGEVPPNSMLTLLAAPLVDSMRTVDTLVRGLGGLAGSLARRDLLLFYCAGRRLHLGLPGAEDELRELERRSGAIRLAGALSLGEIGSTSEWAYPLFHNATLLASVWGGP